MENFTQACIFLLLCSSIDGCISIKPQRERAAVCESTVKEGEEEDGRVEVQLAGHQLRTLIRVCLP